MRLQGRALRDRGIIHLATLRGSSRPGLGFTLLRQCMCLAESPLTS
jgi:hypothetical protein